MVGILLKKLTISSIKNGDKVLEFYDKTTPEMRGSSTSISLSDLG
jgi:hypothetical protein